MWSSNIETVVDVIQKGDRVMRQQIALFLKFLSDEEGQDFAEYALILGAIGVVALAVIVRYLNELMAAFNQGIEALRQARGG
jgi:Flp pilus assembly pilin Flp